jgi:hypothetical protein
VNSIFWLAATTSITTGNGAFAESNSLVRAKPWALGEELFAESKKNNSQRRKQLSVKKFFAESFFLLSVKKFF